MKAKRQQEKNGKSSKFSAYATPVQVITPAAAKQNAKASWGVQMLMPVGL